MDDTAIERYFTQPTQTYQRQYEALRAVFVNGQSQKEVADQLGFQPSTMRQLVYEFRKNFNADTGTNASPFFETSTSGAPLQSTTRTPIRR